MWIVIPIAIVLLGLAFWEVWVCEGTHLGRRFVVWLYDLAANRYDGIKQFNPDWERRFLGEPVATVLSSIPDALLLDVGAGTGRLLRALPPYVPTNHSLICLEPSRRMTSLGRQFRRSNAVDWMRAFAVPLPFAEGTFDVVVSLEVLEFTPSPPETLSELVRVLKPGGWLLITNRVGKEAPWILGKTHTKDEFPEILQSEGFQDVTVYPWQMDYDLAWARKS